LGGAGPWNAALMRPDRFRAVIGLSVPHRPRGPVRPTSVMPQSDDAEFYQLYFQRPGVAEAELDRDPRRTVIAMFYGASGDAPSRSTGEAYRPTDGMVPRNGGFISLLADPKTLPSWLTDADIDFYAGEFARAGFRGGLNWYRNIDRNWELLAPFAGAKVAVPALYVAGDRDLVVAFRGVDQLIATLPKWIPNLRKTIMLPGCGHWTQQERAPEVNAAMIDFLRQLD
jgi:pimeloyl-ACP methyl ester carboxylesterase